VNDDAIQALGVASFMARHMDPDFVEERAAMADAVLAQRPLQGGLLDAILGLPERQRATIMAARYALCMTEPRYLPMLDREAEHAAAIGLLGELIDHLAVQLRENLPDTVTMMLGAWSRERLTGPPR
jgi:hypothetical protein